MFFESDIITSSDIWFNNSKRESVVKNKIQCNFLREENIELGGDILKSLNTLLPDCEVIKFGKMALLLENEFTVFFIIFSTKEILFDKINGEIFPRGNFEALKKKALDIRDSLSQTNDIMVVKRFVANVFLPEKLKDMFGRTMEKVAEIENNRKERSTKRFYQNYKIYPFLVEFQTNIYLNFKGELEKTIKEFYAVLSPFIDETGSLFTFEFSFCDIKLYTLEKLNKSVVAESISISILDYIFSLYHRIINNLTIYRNRIESLSKKLKKIPGKVLIELNEHLKELKRRTFEEYPLLFISILDRYILYEEDIGNPDLTYQIFWNKNSNILLFRRNLELLNEKITNIQSDIRTLLLYKHDRITLYTKDELKVKLNEIKNEQEFQELLAEILENLGYEDIKINCGTRGHDEHGKDIVFSHVNKFGSREWNAFVVKIGKIRAEEGRELYGYVKKIIDQGMDALETEYEDDKGSKFPITRVFIVANDTITDPAKKSIRKKMKSQVFFIDKETLLKICL